MAKKSARKEITKINLKQAALEGLSYERACETAKRAGKPSYRFTVGDKVQVGHLLNCVVDEALEGGYMYLIRSGANSDNYSCWAWTNVRPLDDDKDTHFAKRNSALSRLHYSNRSMYSLLSFQYLFGVDFNPDYQRGSVWDDEDREKLLDSIFMGREIGRFVFKQLPFTRTSNDGNYYEIVDGKQRMLTLLAFYENRFPYKGVFYNDLSAQDKNWFMDASIGVAEIDQSVTRAEVLESLITSASMCTSAKSMKHTMAAHSKFSFANLMVVFAMRLLFTCMKADSGQGTALAVSTRPRFATTLVLSMP